MSAKRKAVELDRGIAVLLDLGDFDGDKPLPTELRLFGMGATATTKGPVVLTEEAGQSVLREFADQGLDLLPFDVGHGMLSPFAPPEGHRAFGWFRPEMRSDGLYAAGIEWTDAGAQMLRAREFRFFSPAIMRDEDSGEIRELINVALTNIPATKGQRPLVAHKTGDSPAEEGTAPMEELLKMLGARTAAEAIQAHGELAKASDGLLSLTGKSSAAEALAEVEVWRKQSTESVKLAERVAELETERENDKREAAIAKLSEEGKLPPSLHDWAKTLTREQLETFASSAPVLGDSKPAEPAAKALADIDETECAVIAQLGLSRDDYMAAKKRLSAEGEVH